MKPLLFLLTITLLTINASCRGDDDLPPIRIKHETFHCKVDGVAWEAYDYRNEGSLFYDAPFDLLYYSDTKSFEISGGRRIESPSVDQSMGFYNNDVTIGNNFISNRNRTFIDWNQSPGCKSYDLDTVQSNNLKLIEIDTVDQYIIGEFEYSAINDCGDKVHITDGYFDLHYRF